MCYVIPSMSKLGSKAGKTEPSVLTDGLEKTKASPLAKETGDAVKSAFNEKSLFW